MRQRPPIGIGQVIELGAYRGPSARPLQVRRPSSGESRAAIRTQIKYAAAFALVAALLFWRR